MIGYALARNFARGYLIFRRVTNRNLPGLGKALDLIKRERVLTVKGLNFHFDPRVGRAYGLMIIHEWNEPETHRFLANVLTRTNEKVNFVNVGASIGEFVIDMATHDKVAAVIAFEPNQESAEAMRKSCEVNGLQNVRIMQKVIANKQGYVSFLQDRRSPTASHIFTSIADNRTSCGTATCIQSTTLDDELRGLGGSTIVLMDIEGGEYLAMKGGLEFIRRCKPLLIFEYNSSSKQSFSLKMVKDLLGSEYSIYRVRSDGRVDYEETNTWNMVAVEKFSIFFSAITTLRYEN